jgi:phenylpropionate dioxygenase-like ring-hydroxylating dioxygenase large terminal subunit
VVAETIELAKNQRDVSSRTNELDVAGEARVYRALRHFWHPVVFSHEVGDDPVPVTLCGQRLVVARLEGEISVFNDLCAHRGTALSLGKVVNDGTALRCAYHGWQYNKEGRCILAPQRPDLSDHLRVRVKKYNAVEQYGMVWVCLEDEPHFPLPAFPQYDDPGWIKAFLDCDEWDCSSPRRTENYCDLAHFAWVHDGTLGSSDRPEIPEHDAWREGTCIRMTFRMTEPADAGKYESAGADVAEIGSTLNTWVHMPLTVLHLGELDIGGGYILFFHPTPLGPKKIRNFTVGGSKYEAGADPEQVRREIREFQAIVYAEDRPVVESQRPEELPEDLSYELHLKGVDTFHLQYRKWLLELSRELVRD